jgi:glycosyltransferase involved in cell wall biosynthesis
VVVGPSGDTRSGKGVRKTPRRILLISNRVMHYRVSVYNYFARRFREHGWEFSVLASEVQEQNRHPVGFELTELPSSFVRYRRHIRRTRPDAVILFLRIREPILWPVFHWLKIARIPVAFWTMTPVLSWRTDPVRKVLYDYVHRMSDALILYGDDLLRSVPKSARHKSFVANNTVNSEDFPDVPESKEEIKQALGVPFEKIVLFVGRIGDERNRKRVDHLIDMFRTLNRDDLGLVIVGSNLPEDLRSRMNPTNTIYMGEIHDAEGAEVSRILKMADVASIPQWVGLGVNQAFFWGLPLVTEDGPQPPEFRYLEDGRNGFVVPEGDVSALRERILYLVDNDDVRAQFSAHARHDIATRAPIEGMFQGFLDCAQFLCESKP